MERSTAYTVDRAQGTSSAAGAATSSSATRSRRDRTARTARAASGAPRSRRLPHDPGDDQDHGDEDDFRRLPYFLLLDKFIRPTGRAAESRFRKRLEMALAAAGGNRSRAAEIAGVCRRTVIRYCGAGLE